MHSIVTRSRFAIRAAIVLLGVFSAQVSARDALWAERTSSMIINQFPNPWKMRKSDGEYRWSYTHGLVLLGMEHVYGKTGDKKYFNYIKKYADHFIDEQGVIETFNASEYNIDSINAGKMLFFLYEETGDERYKKAMASLRQQLDWHPRTSEGGFWHKLKYPWQMWLDGTYMAGPFYTQYEVQYGGGDKKLDDILNWFQLMERKTRDEKTGLLYHGWDESRVQRWADRETGLSPNFWSRAMGWYAMALVDTLDYYPESHAGRAELIGILNRLVDALIPYQHESGLWYQVTDQGEREGNYLEASGSSMFVYAIAKAVRKGYLSEDYRPVAEKGFNGLLSELVSVDKNGGVLLRNVCRSAGLGGNPYRDGSYDYYLSEDVVTNDAHGLGSFILASVEMNR